MKKYLLVSLLLLLMVNAFSQARPKEKEKPPTQSEMDKMMEDEMKGMSEEEKAEMRKMMKGVMPIVTEKAATMADYPSITSNKDFVPAKNTVKIKNIRKKLSQGEIAAYASTLYNKIMTKGDAEEVALIKKIIAKNNKASSLNALAALAMMQGHPETALALSMKSVQSEPANRLYQNNMAAMLTQYGFPEQAIPVLQKLVAEESSNSTVLSNMAYVWLGLGEKDSARFFAGRAIKANPFNADAKVCGGLMEELMGDPVKAGEMYEEAFEDGLNPFTDQVRKNNPKSKAGDIDFEKIKRSIAIYEYFPKDWIKIPLLSCTVSGYAGDYATKEGHSIMRDSLVQKLDGIQMVLSKDIENLTDQGEEAFVKTMGKEMMRGLSFVSKPATTVLIVLQVYQRQWQSKFKDDLIKLNDKLMEYHGAFERATKNLKSGECKKYENAANNYMSSANSLIHSFYMQKAEEYRQWANAWITWNWYVVGNPKNVVLLQDFGYLTALLEMYYAAISEQIVFNSICKPQKEPPARKIAQPVIPNFECPAVISIPAGADFLQLTATARDFNDNTAAISKTNKPIPHSSVSYTAGSRIGQPGFDASLKTSHGDVTATYINPQQRQREMDQQHRANLEMIDALPKYQDSRHRRNLEMIRDLPSWSEIIAIKQLLNKILTADCKSTVKKKQRFTVEVGQITLEGPAEIGTTRQENGYLIEYENGAWTFIYDDGTMLEAEAPNTYAVVGAEDANTPPPPKPVRRPGSDENIIKLKEFKSSFDSNGLSPTISSSLQPPWIFDFMKNLFN